LPKSHKNLFPQINETFAEYEEDFEHKPMGEICMISGFFLIFLVEELVHFFGGSEKFHDHGGDSVTSLIT